MTGEPVRFRALILACCIASGAAWSEVDLFGLPADAAPEDLYWEVLRLRTSELLSEQEFARVQRELDVIDSHYSTDRDRDALVRRVLAGALRRAYQTGTDGENAALLHAQEGRAYARRLHHAGVRESEKYAQRTVLIAGMLGVPTSKEELALIVVLPVGGYIVGKVVGFTYKRAALLLRKLRTPEEVLARAGALGIRVERIESRAGVERLLGKDAAAGIDSAPRASESLIAGAGTPRSPARVEAAGGAAHAAPSIARMTPGSLPAAEKASLLRTLGHIDAGTTPTDTLATKWGTQFKNWAGDLPGARGAASPYLEYRVAPPPGTSGAGPLRVVVNQQTGEMYYTWTHYGDTGAPAFVQIR